MSRNKKRNTASVFILIVSSATEDGGVCTQSAMDVNVDKDVTVLCRRRDFLLTQEKAAQEGR